MKKTCNLLIAGFLSVSLFSCGEKREVNPKTETDGRAMILATVNGVPITENDVERSLKRVSHGEPSNSGTTKNMLDALVRNELIYQKSLELGLDKDPDYQSRISEAEAQLRDYKKQEIFPLYREYLKRKAEVTDSEAREYFGKNSKRIQTKIHVRQIYYRGSETGIAQDDKDLRNGTPFEKVASRRFPNLPKEMKAPWDLGYLAWFQIPDFWRGSIDTLEPGGVSDIIRGPGERFWVINVVDKTVDPNITFDTEKGKIVEVLRERKSEELYDSTLGQMREKSKIVFPKQMGGPK